MFKTPNLHTFLVTWYLQPQQFPHVDWSRSDEFVAERFIEDIMDGRQSISLVVNSVQIPNPEDHPVGEDVGVVLNVTTTEEQAKELIELGYKVKPEHPEKMQTKWDEEPEGMTWGDLLSIVRHRSTMHPDALSPPVILDEEIRITDDSDPQAPWYRAVCLKRDDQGYFLAVEEIFP